MGIRLITVANVIVIEYLLMTQYETPHKWEWLVLTAVVLSAVLVWKREQPKE